jgi:hypothetical protein
MSLHQSQLAPAENKFHVGNGSDGKHYWLTPWDDPAFAALREEFGPFYDPCPYPRPDGYDGLTADWGPCSYVNIPFGSVLRFKSKNCKHETETKKSRTCIHCGEVGKKLGPTAWMRKAIAESRKGKRVLLVYPVDKWLPMMLKEILGEHGEVRNLGDVRWLATEDGSRGKGTGRHIVCFILGPSKPTLLQSREATHG